LKPDEYLDGPWIRIRSSHSSEYLYGHPPTNPGPSCAAEVVTVDSDVLTPTGSGSDDNATTSRNLEVALEKAAIRQSEAATAAQEADAEEVIQAAHELAAATVADELLPMAASHVAAAERLAAAAAAADALAGPAGIRLEVPAVLRNLMNNTDAPMTGALAGALSADDTPMPAMAMPAMAMPWRPPGMPQMMPGTPRMKPAAAAAVAKKQSAEARSRKRREYVGQMAAAGERAAAATATGQMACAAAAASSSSLAVPSSSSSSSAGNLIIN
jgi:hypothetical protein